MRGEKKPIKNEENHFVAKGSCNFLFKFKKKRGAAYWELILSLLVQLQENQVRETLNLYKLAVVVHACSNSK